ncbi:uncharacterized protein LOC106064794 [Biomphalaria glabrata]|uniref:Uncharacterized protein LOC106064794 n=1 Tax=Biomphalaria glabrata TaxID=6526 RepID=A0A9W3BKX9_BIOGL|nr:uncharacterized protein LOC106064794 [Biomphalaria glabrata]
MKLLHIVTVACVILSIYAQTCPPMEMSFLIDQSENARWAGSTSNTTDSATNFNILDQQLRTVFSNSLLLNSASVSVGAYGYSAGESLNIIPYWTSVANAPNFLYQLRSLPNSGSWTYSGLRNIVDRPRYANSILFLITSQGSSSTTRRNEAIADANRVKALGWNIKLLAMQSNNPFDSQELQAIDSNYITISDLPKSYYGLSREINRIINGICNVVPTTTTTTTTTSTSTTTTPAPRTAAPTFSTRDNTGLCSECRYNAGFGYDSDPDYCDTYYRCLPDLKPIKALCPAGTFWDGDGCNFVDAVKCTKAVCSSANQNTTYPSGRCCNKYYECFNSKLYERICPLDQFYDSVTRRCGPTTNKNATCEALGRFECDVNRNVGLPNCNGYAPDVYGNPCKYQFNGYSMSVATGTTWSQTVCSLVRDDAKACSAVVNERAFEPTNNTCNANFLATYNSGSKAVFSERAGTNIDIATTQQEVLLTNNALTFTAAMVSPYLYYYFFNNKDMGIDTAFRVRFSLQGGQDGKTYDILSNSYCSLCPDTIKFTVYQSSANSYVVTATFLTTERVTVETSATISNVNPSNLLEMTVVYSDTSVYGKLYEVNTANTVVRTVDFGRVGKTGGVHIATNKCGIQLGRGANNHFVGIIDEFAVYEKCANINQAFRA